jgi:hypothetical protein
MQKCHLVTLEDAAAQWKSDKKLNEKWKDPMFTSHPRQLLKNGDIHKLRVAFGMYIISYNIQYIISFLDAWFHSWVHYFE